MPVNQVIPDMQQHNLPNHQPMPLPVAAQIDNLLQPTFHINRRLRMDDIYRDSDVVSLHVRLTPGTKGMVGRRALGLMKESAILVNTARGALVDEQALIEALSTNRIRGAGLDVFDKEPVPEGHPLAALPNVVMTPHSGGVTAEALEAGLQMAVDNVFAALAGESSNRVA